MAFVGASSASAVGLCLAKEASCSEANLKKLILLLDLTLIQSPKIHQHCHSHSHKNVAKGTNPALATVGLTFTECEPCEEVTATVSSATLKLAGAGNGILTGNLEMALSGCALGLECKFGAEGVELNVNGSSTNATAVAAKEVLTLKGGSESFCGKSAEWSDTFTGVSEEDKMTWVSEKP